MTLRRRHGRPRGPCRSSTCSTRSAHATSPCPDLDAVRRSTQAAVLLALAHTDDVYAAVAAADPADDRVHLVAGDAVLQVATFALELAVPDGAEPLEYFGLRQRYLPEVEFRGRAQHRNSQYVLYAAASRRGGLQPDIDSDTGWWGAPLWIYATYALTIYTRAAAERTDSTVAAVAKSLALRHGVLEQWPAPRP